MKSVLIVVEVTRQTLSYVYTLKGLVKLKRTEHRVVTRSLKILFEGRSLPAGIRVGQIRYEVRPFVNNIIQCYRCQRIGHTAANCHASKVRCLLCAEEHQVGVCSKGQAQVKCANCGMPHKAHSVECEYIKSANEAERRKASGMSFEEAYKVVMRKAPGQKNQKGVTEGRKCLILLGSLTH